LGSAATYAMSKWSPETDAGCTVMGEPPPWAHPIFELPGGVGCCEPPEGEYPRDSLDCCCMEGDPTEEIGVKMLGSQDEAYENGDV